MRTYFWGLFLVFYAVSTAQEFETLYAEMTGYYQNKEFDKGIAQSERFLDLAEKTYGKVDSNYASALNLMGFFYHQSSRYKEAEELYMASLKIFEQHFGKKHLYYANVAINLADVKTALTQYSAAENLYSDALDYFKTHYAVSSYYLSYLPKLGLLYEQMLKYDDAASVYKKISSIYRDTYGKKSEFYAYGLFLQGQFYEKIASFAEAKSYYESSLDIYSIKVGEHHTSYAYTLNYLAHINDLIGHVAEAEVQYKRALEIYKGIEGDSTVYFASILNNLANLYKNSGRFDEAFKYYYQVAQIYQKTLGEEHEYYATALNNMAIIYTDMGQLDKARELYEKVHKIYFKAYGESHPFYAIAVINLGDFYYKSKNYNKALEVYDLGAKLHVKAGRGNHPDYATTLYKLATVLKFLKYNERALLLGQQALDIQKSQLGEQHMSYLRTLCILGSLYRINNQPQKAEAAFMKMYTNMIKLIDNYFPTLDEKDKSRFYDSIKWMFDDFFDFGVKIYASNPSFGEKLYDAQLNTKAILLNNSHRIRNIIMSSGDSTLINIYNTWKAKKDIFGKTFTMTLGEMQQKGIDLDMLSLELSDLERQISLKSHAFAKLMQRPSCKKVQAKLKDNEVAIEIIRYQEDYEKPSYVALVLNRRQTPKVVRFSDGVELEGKFYAYYSNYIQNKLEDKYSYNLFWKPLNSHIAGAETIYFSGDGVYQKISIKALQDPESKKYLNVIYNIKMVSNTRQLLEAESEPTIDQIAKSSAYFLGYPDYKSLGGVVTSQSLGIFSNNGRMLTDSLSRAFNTVDIPDLEGTRVEVQEIAKVMQSSKIPTVVYTRAEATEEHVKSAKNVGILHIATHGFFIKGEGRSVAHGMEFAGLSSSNFEEHPLLRSGLLLTGAEKTIRGETDKSREDGILTAFEAMNLNLNNTSLVVLSACETGLGNIENGEGVYGLQRAFELAGSRYVLMSLWKVDDVATQELMVNFYTKWLSSGHIHNAFRQAQLDLQQKYKEPKYWAAFVLSGI